MKKFISLFLILSASLVGVTACVVSAIFLSLPKAERIKECLTTEFKQVRLCSTESTYVPLKQIAPIARQAVIISEDASFYSHNGFDWYELRQSAEKNWMHQGFKRGGSTITQQLAKNVFLTGEKSILRKLKEAYLTWRLEKILTKDQILEKYLNVVELGPGIYGIKPAAQHYFGKHPSQLNAAESAFLAMLLPNPISYYTSFRKKRLTDFARKRVLDITKKLAVTGKISDGEYSLLQNSLDGFPWQGGLNPVIPVSDPAVQQAHEDEYATPDPSSESEREPEREESLAAPTTDEVEAD